MNNNFGKIKLTNFSVRNYGEDIKQELILHGSSTKKRQYLVDYIFGKMKLIHVEIYRRVNKLISTDEESLEENKKKEKFDAEEKMDEIYIDATEIYSLLADDEAPHNEKFQKISKLLHVFTGKVDKEFDTLSRRGGGAKTKASTSISGGCKSLCKTGIMRDLSKTLTNINIAKGIIEFKSLSDLGLSVSSTRGKVFQLTENMKKSTDKSEENCFRNQRETVEKMMKDIRAIYNELRKKRKNNIPVALTDITKLENIQKFVRDNTCSGGQVPSTSGCLDSRLREAITMMEDFLSRLEGDNGEIESVNKKIGEELFQYNEGITRLRGVAEKGSCDEKWRRYYQENLRL